jgi:hypothetical protein
LFLLVFFDSQARISLLGKVGRATLVDNLRRRGAAIAGFLNVLFGSRIDLCRDFTKSSYIGTFWKIGNPSFHQIGENEEEMMGNTWGSLPWMETDGKMAVVEGCGGRRRSAVAVGVRGEEEGAVRRRVKGWP